MQIFLLFSDKNTERVFQVRYDMRGHGRSGKPDTIEGYSSQLYADDYAAVAHAFKLKNSVLVGWCVLLNSLK